MTTPSAEHAAEPHAQAASARVLTLWAAYQAGTLTKPDTVAAMGTALYVGKLLASRVADIWISTIANLPPLGITPGPQHVERLEKAASTVLDEHEQQAAEEDPQEAAEQAVERLDRLAVAETLHSHRASLHAAIRDHGFTSWQRVVQPDACEICKPYADEVQPVSVGFKDHPGCRCSLRPYGQPHSVSESEPEPAPRPLVTITRRT